MRCAFGAILLLALAACGDQSSSPSVGRHAGAGPVETRCEAGDQLRVTVFVEAPNDRAFGVHTHVRYPATLDIPGHADDQSVVDRVDFVLDVPSATADDLEGTSPNGLTTVNDQDTDLDGVDDRIHTLVTSIDTFPDGKVADITFDCVATIARPGADLFVCEVSGLTDIDLTEVLHAASCHVVVAQSRSAG